MSESKDPSSAVECSSERLRKQDGDSKGLMGAAKIPQINPSALRGRLKKSVSKTGKLIKNLSPKKRMSCTATDNSFIVSSLRDLFLRDSCWLYTFCTAGTEPFIQGRGGCVDK
jgi:hypothetical protein